MILITLGLQITCRASLGITIRLLLNTRHYTSIPRYTGSRYIYYHTMSLYIPYIFIFPHQVRYIDCVIFITPPGKGSTVDCPGEVSSQVRPSGAPGPRSAWKQLSGQYFTRIFRYLFTSCAAFIPAIISRKEKAARQKKHFGLVDLIFYSMLVVRHLL